MPAISISSDSPAIKRQSGELMLNLARGHPDTLRADCCDTFSGFPSSASKPPPHIPSVPSWAKEHRMVVEARERFPVQCFVWFSDLAFALFAYRQEAGCFSLLPITEDKLRADTWNCMCHAPVQKELAEKPVVGSRLPTI